MAMKLSMTVRDLDYTTFRKSSNSSFGEETVGKMSKFRYPKRKPYTYPRTYFMPYNAKSYDSQPPDLIPVYTLYDSSPGTHALTF